MEEIGGFERAVTGALVSGRRIGELVGREIGVLVGPNVGPKDGVLVGDETG